MNKSEIFWDKRSSKFDERSKHFEQTYIKTIENTKPHLTSHDIVLDYACATGAIASEIAGNVKAVYAIDISSKMIDIAKRKAREHNIDNINFAQSTIFDEKYKKESFEVILAFNILHLLEDPPKVVQRINELLKQGGLFISATPCQGDKMTFLNIFIVLLSKTGIVPYLKFSKRAELENLVINENFEMIEFENIKGSTPSYFIVAKKKQ